MAGLDEIGAYAESDLSYNQSSCLSSRQLVELEEKCPNELLRFIMDNRSDFVCLLKEKGTKPDLMSLAIIVLGRTCNAESYLRKHLNELMITLSSSMDDIVVNIQRYLVFFHKKEVPEKRHLDALFHLTAFLKVFQLTLPSTSLDSVSMLLPLLVTTCDKVFKNEKELYSVVLENLNVVKAEQRQFFEHHSLHEIKRLSESEKLHLQEPPESFRSLSIVPTGDDIHLPCSFLRPNIVKGRYKDTEHYLDVQFRLLREDYIKPLRDGIAEYLNIKRNKQPLNNCKSVRVYSNAFVESEKFVDGDLLHVLQFQEKYFSEIKWENSNRFLTGNLLCLSADDFCSMLFATVIRRDIEDLKKGLLLVRLEEIDEKIFNASSSTSFVVIEVPALFESYRHNLKVLQSLNEESLPMKRYIVDVEKMVNKPEYLLPSTVYDMRPLLLPLKQELFSQGFPVLYSRLKKTHPEIAVENYKSVKVTDDKVWPTASELSLDDSQFNALKSAILKEFSIIQGPPGTGKTYIGLRTVQLLLHNINCWFKPESNSLPILIVCYTNHALDQFLEGILMLTDELVRIGGRCSNENIEKFQIKKLVKSRRLLNSKVFDARDEIEKLNNRINFLNEIIEHSTDRVFTEYDLRKYIPTYHFNSLTRVYRTVGGMSSRTKEIMSQWLEVENFNALPEKKSNDKSHSSITYKPSEAMENDGEADIEFIENQRNIDFYDFDDTFTLKKCSETTEAHNQEWKTQKRNKQKLLNYIRNSLENNPVMPQRRALKIKNVWNLPINERWQLYKFWLGNFLEKKRQEYLNLQQQLKMAFKELSDARIEDDLRVLEDAKIVGMTTTGAAKYRHIIEARNPVIVIVEEAAEILESHIITSLTSKTQHVILIGDQQQLQPSPTVYMLAVKYGMNVSLFERMIKNGMDYCRLSIQHRMRPEIAALIVPHIYSDLQNHKIVTTFENIKGVNKNVFFVNHNFNELLVQDSKSKVNEHEARFIVKFCRYLIFQGYAPSKITVLTTYSGQLFVLKKLAADYDDVKEVRFTVVDNFQGEENDIILISFVRSNNGGEVGFLKVSNRICVALSRAKKGLYCIGNFELLAQKSTLWQKILQTLTANKCIGTSLCLTCQNHPDVYSEVSNEFDFNAVPDGGCNRKCEYRLSCGHSCVLSCHPYDSDHVNIKCEKPCTKTCEQGHQCLKRCCDDCKPCPVTVEKSLTKCGHTVTALCGKSEDEVECQEPCKKTCKEGHPCTKKCFEYCGLCPVIVNKTFPRCKHTVNTECGGNIRLIKCQEACSKSCPKGHPCPYKCSDSCGLCKVIVDKKLPRCGHTVKAECHTKEYSVKCNNQCIKTCNNSHPCQKKCFETCGSCAVLIDKTLSSCGHTVKAPCGSLENKIKCTSQCKKVLPCLHQCANKCYEQCVKECFQLVEVRSPVCGHSLKVECCLADVLDELSKRCLEPCKEVLPCGHTCSGTCSACKQGSLHVACMETCQRSLPCGDGCTNKCSEPCVVTCMNITQILSPVCGHSIKIECDFKDNFIKLSKICVEPCREILPCGHACTGTCSSCFQGRLHIACKETCKRILICGHKCESKCSQSCPPCEKPCESRCKHGRCPRKCGKPCVKCIKPCSWFCSHKKFTRRCNEICDRDPCNERCLKKLPCSHQCIGFCGEPCPKECIICDDKGLLNDDSFSSKNDDFPAYVYLEDCKHSINAHDLSRWFNSNSQGLKSIQKKTCPKCGVIVRRNARFSNIIKNTIANFEKIKLITQWDKVKNLKIQRNLLEQVNMPGTNLNVFYDSIIKVLSGGYIRNINELVKIESMIQIAKELEFKNYGLHSMFIIRPFFETLIHYTRSSRGWISGFIRENFLTVSEYQLQQLSWEVLRLTLLDFLLKFAKRKHFASLSPEFEKCASSLMTFTPFTDDSVKDLKKLTEHFVLNFREMFVKYRSPLRVINMSGCWYKCSKEHVVCFSEYDDTLSIVCPECHKPTNSCLSEKDIISDSSTRTSGNSNIDNPTRKTEESFIQKAYSVFTDDKLLPSDKETTVAGAKYMPPFRRRPNNYKQPFALPQSKRFELASVSDREKHSGSTSSKRNEQHFAGRSSSSGTINRTSAMPYRDHHATRGSAKATESHIQTTRNWRYPSKQVTHVRPFEDVFKKSESENRGRMLPNGARGRNSSSLIMPTRWDDPFVPIASTSRNCSRERT